MYLPDVVVSAEDHAGLGEAGSANLAQLCLTARALQAARVPVAVQRVQQEAILDSTPAPGAAPRRHVAAAVGRDRSTRGGCQSGAHVGWVLQGRAGQVTCRDQRNKTNEGVMQLDGQGMGYKIQSNMESTVVVGGKKE